MVALIKTFLLLFCCMAAVYLLNYLRTLWNKSVIFVCDDPNLYPYKKYSTDAGWDIKAAEDVKIEPGKYVAIATGLRVVIPVGYYGHILPRSGLAVKNGIMTMAGVIDSEYRNEVKVLLYNAGDKTFEVKRGDRIAQLVVTKILLSSELLPSEEAIELGYMETERGTSGFGSTGVK